MAFNSKFIEGETQTYRLEDTNTGTFQLLVQWLYSQELRLRALADDYDGKIYSQNAIKREQDRCLAELRVLADKLSIHALQDFVLGKIEQISYKVKTIPTQTLGYFYCSTTKESLLRRFMVKMVACLLGPEEFDENRNVEFPEEMLLELAKWNAMHTVSIMFRAEEFFVMKGVVRENGRER